MYQELSKMLKVAFKYIHKGILPVCCLFSLYGISLSAALPYPFIDVIEEVATQAGEVSRRANVQPGEIITFKTTITNLDDVSRDNVMLESLLPPGLTYVTNSLLIDGVPKDAILSPSDFWSTVSASSISLSPYGQITLSLQAEVAFYPPQEEFLHYTRLYLSSPVGYEATSNNVFLVFEGTAPSTLADPYFDVTEEVTTTTVNQSKVANVQPNDVVTFTVTIRNLGDIAGEASFHTYLPQGLTYIPHTFLVNDILQEEFSTWRDLPEDGIFVSDNRLSLRKFSVPSYGKCGNPVTVCFQTRVDLLSPTGVTQFENFASVTPRGKRTQYVANSNLVILLLHQL